MPIHHREENQHSMYKEIKVSTVTTLKTSVKETLSFVNYHLNSGIDHMYLFFDDPQDKAIAHLQGYDRVSVISCNNSHWERLNLDPSLCIELKQKANATLALEFAKKDGFEWLIHIDSDELLYGTNPISKILKKTNSSTDVVRFPVMEATPQNMFYQNPFNEIRFFKFFNALSHKSNLYSYREADRVRHEKTIRKWHFKRKTAKLFGSLSASNAKFLYGHQNGKCAVRTSAEIESFECHFPIPKKGVTPYVYVSQTVHVLHFDCMGFDSWKRKWKKRISGENNHDLNLHPKQRVALTKKIEEVLGSQEGLKSLYQDLYILSNYEMTLLRTLGLIKKIRLPAKLFNSIY